MDLIAVAGLGVAALGGAAIGLERQWSGHASGPHARFGGIRTFTMLGGTGGLAGWLSMNGLLPLGSCRCCRRDRSAPTMRSVRGSSGRSSCSSRV